MEFDHAIQYVTRIKRRFSNEPKIYKSFLEILHSYQRNREDIKAVLDRVSHLFADHEDLLTDFAYFLPDTIQSQARERLSREAERQREMRRGGPGARDWVRAGDRGLAAGRHGMAIGDHDRWSAAAAGERSRARDMRRSQARMMVGMGPGRSARGIAREAAARDADEELRVSLPPTE